MAPKIISGVIAPAGSFHWQNTLVVNGKSYAIKATIHNMAYEKKDLAIEAIFIAIILKGSEITAPTEVNVYSDKVDYLKEKVIEKTVDNKNFEGLLEKFSQSPDLFTRCLFMGPDYASYPKKGNPQPPLTPFANQILNQMYDPKSRPRPELENFIRYKEKTVLDENEEKYNNEHSSSYVPLETPESHPSILGWDEFIDKNLNLD